MQHRVLTKKFMAF